MAVSVADPLTLATAAQRALALLLVQAEQMDRAARAAIEELEQGHTKSARASLAAGVGALNEAARILPAATRLARGAVRALDDQLTRTGDHHAPGARRAGILGRRRAGGRRGDRRSGLPGRRLDDWQDQG